MMFSYFSPVPDEVVIDAGQSHGIGIIRTEPCAQRLDQLSRSKIMLRT